MILKTAAVICLLYMVTVTKGDDNCENVAADIAIILDASSSIWGPDFRRQVEFVKTFAEQVGVGSTTSRTHISVITYGIKVVPIFGFNTHPTKAATMKAIEEISHLRGRSTYTHAALKYVRKKIFTPENGARPDVPHIVILLTDGVSTMKELTKSEAKLLKEQAQVFVIGIGRKVSKEELNAIASEPKENYVIAVNNFRELKNKKQLLAYKACEVTTPPPTTTTTTPPATTTTTTTTTEATTTTTTTMKTTTTTMGVPEELKMLNLGKGAVNVCGGRPADIVFVLDKSSSIGFANFRKQLAFINNIVKVFDIGEDTTRVGVISFSDVDELKIEFPLNAFYNSEDIEGAVNRIIFSGGGTDTAAAIDMAMRQMFTKSAGSRSHVVHVEIVITDGQSRDPIATYKAAKDSHRKGISLFAIGVGADVDKTELKDIASNPNSDFMFTVEGFDSLNSIRNLLAKKTCEVQMPQRDVGLCGKGDVDADIVFALDSYSMGGKDIDFIKGLSSKLDIDGSRVRVGVATNCPETAQVRLDASLSREEFHGNLDHFRESHPAPLIEQVRSKHFHPYAGGRRDAKKILVLFVNGPVADYRKALRASLRAQLQGTQVLVVGVGKDIESRHLDGLASRPAGKHVMQIGSVDELPLIQHKLEDRLCREL